MLAGFSAAPPDGYANMGTNGTDQYSPNAPLYSPYNGMYTADSFNMPLTAVAQAPHSGNISSLFYISIHSLF